MTSFANRREKCGLLRFRLFPQDIMLWVYHHPGAFPLPEFGFVFWSVRKYSILKFPRIALIAQPHFAASKIPGSESTDSFFWAVPSGTPSPFRSFRLGSRMNGKRPHPFHTILSHDQRKVIFLGIPLRYLLYWGIDLSFDVDAVWIDLWNINIVERFMSRRPH